MNSIQQLNKYKLKIPQKQLKKVKVNYIHKSQLRKEKEEEKRNAVEENYM